MTLQEAKAFRAAYERARKGVTLIRGRVTPPVRAAQDARRAYFNSVVRALDASV